jgi:hypothetical protein
MANSTQVYTDTHTLAKTSFSAASVTKSKTIDNIDLSGQASAVAEAISQAKRGLQLIISNLDSADPQLVLANDILGTLS